MRARLFILDNYDSFTWNLVGAFRALGAAVCVRRNDATTLDHVLTLRPSHVVISPGPGRPEAAGLTLPLLRALLVDQALPGVPVLGVCLGHQALAMALGGEVVGADSLVHGKASLIDHDGEGLFRGLPARTPMGRYHSLAVAEASLPSALQISARAPDGQIMGLRHRTLPVESVQFHPESVLSPYGPRLLANFLVR